MARVASSRFVLAGCGFISRIGVTRDRQGEIALRYREGLTHENEQLVLRVVEPLLALVKLRVVRIVVFRVLAPRACCVVCSRGGGIDATIGVQTHACELGESVGMPVKRQLRSVIEAVAVVIGSA